MYSVSVIIPCLKEAENLKFLLPQIIESLKDSTATFEIIIVDNSVPLDDTPNICSKFLEVQYISTIGTDNYGNAVRTGIASSNHNYILFMDADGSHDPQIIPKMVEKINKSNICIASRYCEGGSTKDKVTSIFLSKVLNFIYSLVLGVKCSDWSGSFKIYKSALLKELKLESNNFDIIPEILFKMSQASNFEKIEEVPYVFDTRIHGQTKRKLKTYIDFLITLIKLRLVSRK